MAPRKYYERILIVVGILFVFFVITMMSLSLVVQSLGINRDTREGMWILSGLQAVLLFILPAIISAFLINRKPGQYLALNRAPSWLAVTGVIFAYLIAFPALNQIIYWNSNLCFPESWETWGETLREMENGAQKASAVMLDTTSVWAMIVNLLIVGLLTAFGEELFFRGTLQRTIASSGAYYGAIWIVAFIFSAVHFQFFGFIPRLLLGAWFGYLLFWTRSVWVPVIAHFINNGVVVVFAWLSSRGLEFNIDRFGVTEYGFPMPAFVSALAFVVFVIFFRNFFFGTKEEISPSYGN